MRITAFLFLFAIVNGLEPLTIAGLIGMGLASGYAYVRPNFYYRGNLEVCISGNDGGGSSSSRGQNQQFHLELSNDDRTSFLFSISITTNLYDRG